MTARYLLDTNILSEPLAKRPAREVMVHLERYQGELATAAPVWHELVFGYRRLPESKKRRTIQRYLRDVVDEGLSILPYERAAAVWHARERARLTAKGETPPFVDGQIAAIAHVHGLTLVTRNEDDFLRFSDVEVQNWFSPFDAGADMFSEWESEEDDEACRDL